MFGPDTSSGLLPMPHTLFYYAIFFGFGAWYWTCRDSADAKDARLGRYWWLAIPIAVCAVLPIGRELVSGGFGWREKYLAESWHRPAADVAKVLYAWMMSLGCIGLFRWLLPKHSCVLRYVSDSSYWLYLAHLPLVIWLSFETRTWPYPAFVKFLGVCTFTTAVLLVSYQLFVRHTPIGWLLNGRGKNAAQAVVSCPPQDALRSKIANDG